MFKRLSTECGFSADAEPIEVATQKEDVPVLAVNVKSARFAFLPGLLRCLESHIARMQGQGSTRLGKSSIVAED
jgi:hypothetical protein